LHIIHTCGGVVNRENCSYMLGTLEIYSDPLLVKYANG